MFNPGTMPPFVLALVVQRSEAMRQQHATIMNPILTYTIILSLPVLFLTSGYEKSQTPLTVGQYCNSTYNFCVKYPESLLPVRKLLPDDSGIVLRTEDELSEVRVSAVPGAPAIAPQALFEAALKKFSGEVTVISSAFGDDYYEAYFLDAGAGTGYFHRVFYFPRHYIRLVARVPVSRPWLIERLKEDVIVQFDK